MGKPFDEVIKGAKVQPGFFPVWRKDEKVWLEVPLASLGQPFLFSVNISNSVGERGLYASQMGPSWLANFKKIGNSQIQLVALNTNYVASNAAMQTTVEQSFSHSLLGWAALVSAPHPERKSVLIEATFLLADIPSYATQIEQAYRLPYSLDKSTSFFEKTQASADLTTLSARMHYSMARIPAPPLVPSPMATPGPSTLPDQRSFFVGYVYNFSKLPAQPMKPRRADPRLGHFSDAITDFSTDTQANPKVHHLNRWRLEKSDPSATLSPPKKPIVYWLDKNIPVHYRKAVEAGVLEWNKAFEKIGFSDAIVVKHQPLDADWDTLDAHHAAIRWFTGADAGFARGPSQSDPRTGEILDADIAMSDVFGRSARRLLSEDGGIIKPLHKHLNSFKIHAHCSHAVDAATDMHFALDLLEARGDIAPDSPEADAFVQAVIKDTITHEVGHTLGLKHNFKGSTVYTRKQLQDKNFTEKNGISGSVMDYNAFNLSVAGETPGSVNNTALGPYDYWAIEYAYKPFDAADEPKELSKIAARSTEPLLAYADDVEAGGMFGNDGIDPLVNRFDLGDEPLAYYQKRLQLSRELWQRVQNRPPKPGDDATRARRVLLSGFRPLMRAADLVGKYVGGMHTVRDLPGTSQRASYTPVEPTKQREALKFLTQGIFNAESFRFSAPFLASLGPDYNEFERGGQVSIASMVLQVQAAALDRLLSAGTAQRLLDLPLYLPPTQKKLPGVISLNEVYTNLQTAIWQELKTGQDIDRLRRNLQREHLKRVQALLLRSSTALPPDALSLVRLHATELQAQLRQASNLDSQRSVETSAHINDSLSQLTEALRASMLRS